MGQDMRTWIDRLDRAGLLARISKPVDPRTQMGALLWQARDRALLFENLPDYPGWRCLGQAPGDVSLAPVAFDTPREEMIPEFVRQWEEGFEVVGGVLRKRRDYRILKTIGAKIAYWMIYTLSDCKIPANATDFRLLDRKVVNALRLLREPDRYLRGLVHWVGFRRVYVPYDRAARSGGRSTAGLWFCVSYALNAMLCFSTKPLRLATFFGGLVVAASFGYALFALAIYFLRLSFIPVAPPGVTTIVLLISFFLGFNTMFLGIIGEYVARIYNQGKNRPLYLVDEQLNFAATIQHSRNLSSTHALR